MPKPLKDFSHLNESIPDLAAAAAEKAEQAKVAKTLAKKVIAAGRRGVR